MAQFILDIPDSAAARIAQAVCAHDGYGPPDMAAAIDHTKGHVFRYLAALVIGQEAGAAATAAADAVRGNADDPLAAALFTPIPGPVGPQGPDGPTGPLGPEPGFTGSTAMTTAIRKGRK